MTAKVKSFFIGSLSFAGFAMLRKQIALHNMFFYITACCIFLCVTMLSYYLINKKKQADNPVKDSIICITGIAILGAWIVLFYINELNAEHPLDGGMLIRNTVPFPIWISLMIIGLVLCLLMLRREPSKSYEKIRKFIRKIIVVVFTFLTSIQFYAPNIFQDTLGGTYHSHAYTNSIINVCWLVPYSENMEPLYGHYAIVFMPMLKILHRCFHIDYITGIFLVAAVVAGISILLFSYILDVLVNNDLIFYLGLFSIGEYYFQLMQGGVYLQVHPHRMIFPIFFAALALKEYKDKKRYNLTAILMLALSFVWSTEVGIVIMLAFTVYRWIFAIADEKAFSVRKILCLPKMLFFYVLIPFSISYVVVNGYNLAVGGKILEFKEFMYPLISNRDYISNIELELPNVTHAWIGATILFMSTVCYTLFNVFFSKKEKNGSQCYFFFLGVMSLGLMLYYINRPAEGCIFIDMFFVIILQSVILQKCQNYYIKWKEKEKSILRKPYMILAHSFRVISLLILIVMAFDGVYSMPAAWKKSSETIWKRNELKEFAEHVGTLVPEDAVSFGEGVPELLSMIDRDTHLHTTEWSYLNMPLETMECIRYDLEDEPWFFCSLFSLSYMQTYYPGLTDDYYLNDIIEYNGVQFGVFKRN